MNNETTGEATPYTPEEPLKIAKIVIDEFKRVRHVTIVPPEAGVTTIAGANKAGKTSILDAIAYTLFGPEASPRGSKLINTESTGVEGARSGTLSQTVIDLSDGSTVTRKLTAKNDRTGILEIKLPKGREGSLEDVKNCISKFAVIPSNMGSMTERERTKHLLAGVDVDLSDLEEMLEQVNTERQGLFQAKEDCKRHAQDLPEHPGVPTTEVTASSIMSELQAAMTANSANIAKRQDVEKIVNKIITLKDKSMLQYEKVVSLEAQLEEAKKMHDTSLEEGEAALKEHEEATAGTVDLVDIPTDELQQQLEDVDQLNQKIRQNSVRAQKFAEADGLRAKWNEKEEEQNQILFEMKSRVESADIPLPGLSIDDKLRVTFDDMIWSNCSSMQHMVVETAIASLYNKAASFVLADGLEALDLKSQSLFHRWAISRGLQVICTVVKESFEGEADDGRCRVLISDGKNV